ncbi:MAG: copper chaperone PCu(A)C [Pseudoxanthomonas suwonensis]|nr:copper chaperone PCu(A)C [Pseudoxanthomonas suwonensis]
MKTSTPLLSLPLCAALSLTACNEAPAPAAAPEARAPAATPASPPSADAGTTTACGVQVEEAWARVAPGGMPMHGGFMQVVNTCDQPVAIMAADSPFYGHVELHETRTEDGVSKMRKVDALTVPADGRIELAPGGLHLMLMDPVDGLGPGDTVKVRFSLDNGERVETVLELRDPAG